MNFIVRINKSLSRFPPLVIYAVGLADAVIIIGLGIYVSGSIG